MVEYGPQPLYFGKYCRIGGSTIRSVQTAKTRWPRALLTRQGRARRARGSRRAQLV